MRCEQIDSSIICILSKYRSFDIFSSGTLFDRNLMCFNPIACSKHTVNLKAAFASSGKSLTLTRRHAWYHIWYISSDIKQCFAGKHTSPSAGKSGTSAIQQHPWSLYNGDSLPGCWRLHQAECLTRTMGLLAIPFCSPNVTLLGYCGPLHTLNPEALFVSTQCNKSSCGLKEPQGYALLSVEPCWKG